MSLYQEHGLEMKYSNRKEPCKAEWREKLLADTKAFKKAGGKVKYLAPEDSLTNRKFAAKMGNWKDNRNIFQVAKHRRPTQ